MKKLGLGVIIFILILSCKKTFEKNNFKIIIELRVLNNYRFQVFYKTKVLENYSDNRRVSKRIEKNFNYQNISFELPNNVIPSNIRIDLGERPNHNEIKISRIILINKNKKFVIEDKMLIYFFKPNIYLDFDKEKNTLKSKVINNKFDPYLTSTPLLNKKIEIYFK